MLTLIGVGLLLVGAFLIAKGFDNGQDPDEMTDISEEYEHYYAELGLDKQFDPARPGSEEAVREYQDFMEICEEDLEERMIGDEE
tara:strand:+ start:374 stop:628 length:255 start_codon:yes stop_codon:yes gene_type:complete